MSTSNLKFAANLIYNSNIQKEDEKKKSLIERQEFKNLIKNDIDAYFEKYIKQHIRGGIFDNYSTTIYRYKLNIDSSDFGILKKYLINLGFTVIRENNWTHTHYDLLEISW